MAMTSLSSCTHDATARCRVAPRVRVEIRTNGTSCGREQRHIRTAVDMMREQLRDVSVTLTAVVSDVGDQLTLLMDRTGSNVKTKQTDVGGSGDS